MHSIPHASTIDQTSDADGGCAKRYMFDLENGRLQALVLQVHAFTNGLFLIKKPTSALVVVQCNHILHGFWLRSCFQMINLQLTGAPWCIWILNLGLW